MKIHLLTVAVLISSLLGACDAGSSNVTLGSAHPEALQVSIPAVSTPSPAPTALPTSVPEASVAPVYRLVRRELDVSLAWMDDVVRPSITYRGDPAKFVPPAYDPIRALKRFQEGEVEWDYQADIENQASFIGRWSKPPEQLVDGQAIDMEESITLKSAVGNHGAGNLFARLCYNGGSCYWLVTDDAGGSSKDPNYLAGHPEQVNTTLRSVFDQPLKTNGDQFEINVYVQFGNSRVGWWYIYEKVK